MTLLELAELCEAGTGPDREIVLLRQAFLAMFPEPDAQYQSGSNRFYFTPEYSAWTTRECRFRQLLSVKAFLDAAMTLVPEGHIVSSVGQTDSGSPQRAWFAETRRGFLTSYDEAFPCWSAAPALALCAAALRAGAAIADTHAKRGDDFSAPSPMSGGGAQSAIAQPLSSPSKDIS